MGRSAITWAVGRVRWPAALLLATLAASRAFAQIGDSIPHARYYLAVQSMYAGEYREAERGLLQETRRGIRTAQTRWVDAICYHAMLGEVLYHEGRNAEALTEFDQACQVLLAYPNWLLQVQFQQPPRPDVTRARRAPPWGRSERNATLGQFSDTEQVLLGELDPRRTMQEGGVYRTPMMWRVNVAEIIRASALAIRRRGELLGPLAANDRTTKELSDVLSRGNLSPPNHWSVAWIDLLRGIVQASIGKLDEADMLLGRAVTIEGQFDHPLTCVALLEQGRLAMVRGDSRRAATLLAEAGFSAFYYEDWNALTESVRLGWINHLATGSPGVYPPLEPIVAWAQINRLQHIATTLRLAHAESLLWLGQTDPAGVVLEEAARRVGELRRGLAGIQLLYLQANLQLVRGQYGPGGEALAQAIAAQAGVSLRNFQINLTGEMYDSQAISPRIAADLYNSLLADPTAANWALSPLDSMAVLQTSQDAAFDRWFVAALDRKDHALALEVAEKAKRRRYLASLPLGGRLLAIRTLLEAPPNELPRDALLQRQQLLASIPAYQPLADAGIQLYDALRGGPVLSTDAAEVKAIAPQYEAWGKNAVQRQHLLMLLAGRRLPSSIVFPPQVAAADLQKTLADGEALVEFHAAAGELHGLVITRAATHLWHVGNLRRLRVGVTGFLQALGNYSSNRTLSAEELAGNRWQKPAADLYAAIFSEARLDLSKTKSLIIVPDNLLWYVPFDALVPDITTPEQTLADRLPIRYGPTAALAVTSAVPLRRPQHTGIVANEVKLGGNKDDTQAMLEEMDKAVIGPLRLPSLLPQPANLIAPLLDTLVVLDDVAADRTAPSGPLPLPRGRGNATDTATALPYGGPQRVIVTGYATAAEQGLKTSRRETARDVRPGSEVFQTLCGMMATGARTILIDRWRTGGRTNLELVREFARELPQSSATEAWQRACLLAREAPLDAQNEPRLKGLEDAVEVPTAAHPFFWAGYLLVDTARSPVPEKQDQANEANKSGDAKPGDAKKETVPAKPDATVPAPDQPGGEPSDSVSANTSGPANNSPPTEK